VPVEGMARHMPSPELYREAAIADIARLEIQLIATVNSHEVART
jgi:hypothetical protein